MKICFSRLFLWFIAIAFFLTAYAATQDCTHSLRFHVKLSSQAANEPVSGRLIVLFTSLKRRARQLTPGFGATTKEVWITAKEIHNWRAGETVELGPGDIAFPKPISEAGEGNYQAMAILDVNHDFAYRGASPGDLLSRVVAITGMNPANSESLDLALTERISEPEMKLPPSSEWLDFVSHSLSQFWGKPIHMRGIVVLPPGYDHSKKKKYPTVYWNQAYGGSLSDLALYAAPDFAKLLAEQKIPPMIYVLLDQSCPGGTHEFVDSVNNGPWGTALTQELIPYLESKYRMDGKSAGRLLTGHSSGGWAALWLQVAYPNVFGGSWPTSPDPSDFRDFLGPNLRATPPPNFYRQQDGSPWMLVRENGKEDMSLEDFARQEKVLGSQGGQMTSFEWVFSPRAPDGGPLPLFDRASGMIDPKVAEAWEKYDIAEVLRKNAPRLRRLLQGKIHLTVGTADTFHLDGPAHLLQQTMKELGIDATFTFMEGRNHFNLYDAGLTEKIAGEMEQVARPSTRKRSTANHLMEIEPAQRIAGNNELLEKLAMAQF